MVEATFSFIKLVFFILTVSGFGFLFLSRILKIQSLILLISLSITTGISSCIFLCHIFSYILGPRLASLISVFILFFFSIIILFFNHKNVFQIELEIKKNELFVILAIALFVSFFTFLCLFRFGILDKEFHVPMALTLYNNNIYPPRDTFRSEYILLYHLGGDLLAVIIYAFCKINIFRSFEIISTLFSGTAFLSYFALAWTLTKHYRVSLLAGFCTYFGGGLLWFDAIFRYLFKALPEGWKHWGFTQTFLSLGIHGGVINPPSIHAFVPTSGIGNPVLVMSIILFWKMLEEKIISKKIMYIVTLTITFFTLFLTAEWLYVTFWAGAVPLMFIYLLKKNKDSSLIVPTLSLLFISFLLNNTLGNVLFLQNEIQTLGRLNIFNVSLKEKLFEITSWGRLNPDLSLYKEISFFSWDFISEFGFSLILIPLIVIYLIKNKKLPGVLLFLIATFTMPLPLIFNFKANPVDFNRLFAFGNSMLVMLITISIFSLYKIMHKKIMFISYITLFCFSPLAGLISGAIMTPYISMNKSYIQKILGETKNVKTLNELKNYFDELNKILMNRKIAPIDEYKNEIDFLSKYGKPEDVAISSFYEIPFYAGIYTIVPAKKYLYKDILFSPYDYIYSTVITTLDPHLLNELNIKWLLVNEEYLKETRQNIKEILNNKNLFKLVYKNSKNVKKEKRLIFKVQDLNTELKNFSRVSAWLLVNSSGEPVEITTLGLKKLSMFSSMKEALFYLKDLYNYYPDLKKQLVTAQAFNINSLENQLKSANSEIKIKNHGF